MGTKVSTDLTKSITLQAPAEKVFALLADIPVAVGECFPDLEEFGLVAGNRYRHQLEPVGAMGLTLHPRWEAEYFNDPEALRLWWKTDAASGNAGLDGEIFLTPSGTGCRLEMRETFWIWLGIPSLMAGMARPVLKSNLETFTARYLENIRSHLQG